MRGKLISTGKVAELMGVSARTVEKWAADPASDFPKPVSINNRLRFDEREVDRYVERLFSARDRAQREVAEILEFGRKSA